MNHPGMGKVMAIRFYNFCTYLVPFFIVLFVFAILVYGSAVLQGVSLRELDSSFHALVFFGTFVFGGIFCAFIEIGGTASDKPWFGPGLRIRLCPKCGNRMSYAGIYGVCPEDGHWNFLYECRHDGASLNY